MNTFALTIDPIRYDAAKKSGQLELIGISERNCYHIAELRGTIEQVTLYAKDRKPMSAAFAGSIQKDRDIVVSFDTPERGKKC